jgi:hypothetical protein
LIPRLWLRQENRHVKPEAASVIDLFFVALFQTVSGAPAAATEAPAASQPSAPAAQAPAQPERRCWTEERVNSNLRRRVCVPVARAPQPDAAAEQPQTGAANASSPTEESGAN